MMQPVQCRGCGCVVGWSENFRGIVHCTLSCAEDFPVSANEERDSLVELLGQLGRSPSQIASALDTSRQRVHQILAQRKIA